MAVTDLRSAPGAVALPIRYDGPAMAFHWLTAFLVVIQFALAEIWGFVPRGTPLRHGMQSIHISLGLMLAAVFLLRLVWRNTGSRRMAPLVGGAERVASMIVHNALYGLLALQIALGFLLRWTEGPVGFFGLFGIPSPLTIGKAAHHDIAYLHDKTAWIIIILAGGHATVALAHRYILRDQVLQRMLPRSRVDKR